MYISSSVTVFISQWHVNGNNHENEISLSWQVSFMAVGYQKLAFIQVLENQKTGKKNGLIWQDWEKNGGWNKSKFTGLFTLPSAMASSLASPPGNAPGKWNHWGLLRVSEKNNVCSRCSQVQHFPLTLKRVQMLSFDKTGMPTSLLDFFSRNQDSPT